jgi:hypothetical protein
MSVSKSEQNKFAQKPAARRFRPPRHGKDWVWLVVGIGMFAFFAHSLWWGYSSTHWPRIDAVVTESSVHRPLQQNPYIELRYEFDYGGQHYTGDRWRYNFQFNAPDWMFIRNRSAILDAFAASYPKGQQVKVAVRPGDPTESVLEPGMSWDDIILGLFGLLLALVAFVPKRHERRSARHVELNALKGSSQPSHRTLSAAQVLAFLGVLLMGIGLYLIYRAVGAAIWPEAQGTVLYRSVGSVGAQGIQYRANVRYEYFVSGDRYLGDAYMSGSRSQVKAWADPLQKGSSVQVHYNPLDVGDSVLGGGITWQYFMFPAFALALFGIAWLIKKAGKHSAAVRAAP